MQPIGPALAELLNPAINRGDAGMGSGTGLQPPPDNSCDRRAGGEAAAHRGRASTNPPKACRPIRCPTATCRASGRQTPLRPNPQPPGARAPRRPRRSPAGQLRHRRHHPDARSGTRAAARPADRGGRRRGAGAAAAQQDGGARRQGHRRRAGKPDPRRPPGIQGRRRQRQAVGAAPAAAPGEIRRRRAASSSSPNTSRRATSRPRSRNWSRASTATTARRCCSASPARARPTPWPR